MFDFIYLEFKHVNYIKNANCFAPFLVRFVSCFSHENIFCYISMRLKKIPFHSITSYLTENIGRFLLVFC